MRKLLVIVFAVVFVSLISIESNAQFNKKMIRKNNKRMRNFKGKKNNFSKNKKYNYVGITLNTFNYFGDLSPLPKKISTDISFTKPAIGVTFGHRFGPRYTLRGEFRYGGLSGSDFESADPNDENARFRYVRNLQFRNRIKELTVTGVFDLFKNGSTYVNRVDLTPYAFVGVTLFHHNPQAFVGKDGPDGFKETWVDLKPLGTEGQNLDLPSDHPNSGEGEYKKLQIAIPFGIGVRYKLNEVFDISLEMATRFLFTDHIDDVSGSYVDKTLFEDGSLSQYLSDRSTELTDAVSGNARDGEAVGAVTQGVLGQTDAFGGYGSNYEYNIRGNSNDNDLYFVTTLRLSYVIGASFRKAKFR